MDPVELRNAAEVLEGIANIVELKQGNTTTAVIDETTIEPKTYDVDGRQYTADQIRTGGWDREQLALCNVSETDIIEIFGPATTTASTTEDNNTSVDLDEEGLPWDVRIHSANKSKLARGNTWKLKRGVDSALVETVKQELRDAMSASATKITAVDNTSTEDDNSNVVDINSASPAGPAGPASAPASPAGPASPEPVVEVRYVTSDGEWTREQLIGAGYDDATIDAFPVAEQAAVTETTVAVTFPELMQLVTPALAANTITEAQIATALPEGITSLTLLSARPDLVPVVKTALFG